MKKYVKSSMHRGTVDLDLHRMLEHPHGRKIFGKFMNISVDCAEVYLQGVVDTAEVCGLDIPDLDVLWNAVLEHGIYAVRDSV